MPSTSTGRYTACVLKKTGAVRVIDYQAGKRCTTKEKTISWSKGWRYRGTWAAAVSYAVGDVSVQNGSSYLAKIRSTGKAPAANPAAWGLLAQAAAGAQGPAGPVGARGPAGPVNLTYVQSGPSGVAAGEQDGVDVDCPDGMTVTGGGIANASTSTAVTLNSSYPFDNDSDADILPNNGWSADINNETADMVFFNVYAICTTATSVVGLP
jgi:hypothetical protein